MNKFRKKSDICFSKNAGEKRKYVSFVLMKSLSKMPSMEVKITVTEHSEIK